MSSRQPFGSRDQFRSFLESDTYSTSSDDDNRGFRVVIGVGFGAIEDAVVINGKQSLVVVFVAVELNVNAILLEQVFQPEDQISLSVHFNAFSQSMSLISGSIDRRAERVFAHAIQGFVSHNDDPWPDSAVLGSVGFFELALEPLVLGSDLIPTEFRVIIEFGREGDHASASDVETEEVVIHSSASVDH